MIYYQQPGNIETNIDQKTTATTQFQVQLLSVNGNIPTRATDGTAGYDINSAQGAIIPPHLQMNIRTYISIVLSDGTYAQIMPRSGLAFNRYIDTKADIIDPDFCGNIAVLLHNSGQQPHSIQVGDHIAQLIFFNITQPMPRPVTHMNPTDHNEQCFCSTGLHQPILHQLQCNTTAEQNTNMPIDVWMSLDPFNSLLYQYIYQYQAHTPL